ncbi:hypothetical protein NDU88_002531 [Pleurodeles waltl]|uniref:Uncharacterized protein n=1 Tax=Pleurodeles waltl TaxID=8319 RepID=A0AAV7L1H9_PLEWA|nr:hypothetical protein NDU88_002531 [Pleurodeles waltl]
MHRASVQARFALSSRRRRPPRSSSPQEVHGVKPPQKHPPALPCRLRSVALRGELTKELWRSPGIIASDRDPLDPSLGCRPPCFVCPAAPSRAQSQCWAPLFVGAGPPEGVAAVDRGPPGTLVRSQPPSSFFFTALRRPQIRPQNSLPFGARPLKVSLGTPALSARQWGGMGVHCISGWTGVGIASRSLTERLLLPSASGHAPMKSHNDAINTILGSSENALSILQTSSNFHMEATPAQYQAQLLNSVAKGSLGVVVGEGKQGHGQ